MVWTCHLLDFTSKRLLFVLISAVTFANPFFLPLFSFKNPLISYENDFYAFQTIHTNSNIFQHNPNTRLQEAYCVLSKFILPLRCLGLSQTSLWNILWLFRRDSLKFLSYLSAQFKNHPWIVLNSNYFKVLKMNCHRWGHLKFYPLFHCDLTYHFYLLAIFEWENNSKEISSGHYLKEPRYHPQDKLGELLWKCIQKDISSKLCDHNS